MGIRFGVRFLAVLGLFSTLVAQQQRQVVVVKPDDLEVRRTALQLRVSEQRVLNARAALEAATALVARIEDDQLSQVSQLGTRWVRIDPLRAPTKIENLIAGLRRRAMAAESGEDYRRVSQSALQLAGQLDREEGGTARSDALLEDWPQGPDGAGSDWKDSVRNRLEQERVRQLVSRNPVAALEQLSDSPASPEDWQTRAGLLRVLGGMGHEELIGPAADELLTIVESLEPSERMRALHSVGQVVAGTDPERFDRVLRLMAETSLASAEPADPNRRVLASTGNPELELSEVDRQMLGFMRSLQNQPTALLKVAEASPGLAAWIEAQGGVDRVLSHRGPNRVQEQATIMRTAGQIKGAEAESVVAWILASEDRLQLQVLAGAVNRYCHRPADAEAILVAAASQSRILKVQEASTLLRGLIRTSVRCLATLPDEVATEAGLLIDELRTDDPGQGEAGQRNQAAAEQLELDLATAEVVFEFEASRAAIEALEDESLQFKAWLQAARTLSRP